MLELLGLGITGGAAFWGYLKSRKFVRSRLRFVDAAHTPSAPIMAGAAAALITTPLVLLPLIGVLFPVTVGVGVALGVAHGSKDVKRLTR